MYIVSLCECVCVCMPVSQRLSVILCSTGVVRMHRVVAPRFFCPRHHSREHVVPVSDTTTRYATRVFCVLCCSVLVFCAQCAFQSAVSSPPSLRLLPSTGGLFSLLFSYSRSDTHTHTAHTCRIHRRCGRGQLHVAHCCAELGGCGDAGDAA